MDPKLSHLSDEQVFELLRRYYDGSEKVQALIDEFQINVRPRNLISTFPPEVHEHLFCPY